MPDSYLSQLKADIACEHIHKAFTPQQIDIVGDTFIAVPGINSWANIIPVLKKLKTEQVTIACDMDMLTNPYVKQAVADLFKALKAEGLTVNYAIWAQENGKGIDDLFLNAYKPKIMRSTK